jgi:hypothetical protein
MASSLKNGGMPLSATALIDSLNQKQATSTDPTILTPSQLAWLQQGEPEIDEVLEEEEEVVPFQYDISTSGRDYDVFHLVTQLKNGDIVIPTFQRGYVWSLRDASRFVESLLFGLPVPNIFLSVEPESQKLLVVDGRQRLSTIQYFYDGIWPITKREFALRGTGEKGKYEGSTYKSLPDVDKRRLDHAQLRASIIRQDAPSEDSSSIYHVFERLNTSGVSLTPQEIRAAIYHGGFSDLIGDLNKNRQWREIYGPENKFMRDQELILRFFAFYYNLPNYRTPMKEFLNKFMAWNRYLARIPAARLTALFSATITLIFDALGKQAFRPVRSLNTAVFDSVMVGVGKRLTASAAPSASGVRTAYQRLVENDEFILMTQHSTGHPTNVERRFEMALEAFGTAQ